jgi:hypothetical protein
LTHSLIPPSPACRRFVVPMSPLLHRSKAGSAARPRTAEPITT